MEVQFVNQIIKLEIINPFHLPLPTMKDLKSLSSCTINNAKTRRIHYQFKVSSVEKHYAQIIFSQKKFIVLIPITYDKDIFNQFVINDLLSFVDKEKRNKCIITEIHFDGNQCCFVEQNIENSGYYSPHIQHCRICDLDLEQYSIKKYNVKKQYCAHQLKTLLHETLLNSGYWWRTKNNGKIREDYKLTAYGFNFGSFHSTSDIFMIPNLSRLEYIIPIGNIKLFWYDQTIKTSRQLWQFLVPTSKYLQQIKTFCMCLHHAHQLKINKLPRPIRYMILDLIKG